MSELIKKPNIKTLYTAQDIIDIEMCEVDPIYFIEKFVMVQHPKKGRVPLILYPFQVDMVEAYHKHRFVIAMTARQMGKCVAPTTSIMIDGREDEIYTLMYKRMSFREKVVAKIERFISNLL